MVHDMALRLITKNNYCEIFCAWCNKNGIPIFSHEILMEIFTGCETDEDYSNTLLALFDILINGELFKTWPILWLSLMNNKDNGLDQLKMRLGLRLELFARVPSGTNMMLAYNLMEELTLKIYKLGQVTMDDKSIERFDKLKNLALGNKNINERKLAFDKSIATFKKLTQLI